MDTPGIHDAAQVAGWRTVTDAVHEAGGRIAAQLWHVGRVSHESFHDGGLPVSASALPYRNRTSVRGEDGRPVRVACPTPRALELARDPAGRRGLPPRDGQRPRGRLRPRRDPRRPRLPPPPVPGRRQQPAHRRVRRLAGGARPPHARGHRRRVGAWSADRVAIRISPIGAFNGTEDPEGAEAGLHVAGELGRRGLAFLHLSEPDWAGGPALDDDYRRALRGPTPARSSAPAATTSPRPSGCSTPGSSTPPPSAGRSSPTPTCRGASPRDSRSTRSGPRPSTAATRRATPTTRRTTPPEASPAASPPLYWFVPRAARTPRVDHDMQDFPPRIATFFTGTDAAPTPDPDTRSPAAFLRWMLRQQWQVIALSTLSCLLWLLPLTFGPYIFGRAVDDGILGRLDRAPCWAGPRVMLAVVLVGGVFGVVFHTLVVRSWLISLYGTTQMVTRKVAQMGHVLPRRSPTGEVLSVSASDSDEFGALTEILARSAAQLVSYLTVAAIVLTMSRQLGVRRPGGRTGPRGGRDAAAAAAAPPPAGRAQPQLRADLAGHRHRRRAADPARHRRRGHLRPQLRHPVAARPQGRRLLGHLAGRGRGRRRALLRHLPRHAGLARHPPGAGRAS